MPRGRAGVDRPLAGAQAGDLLSATAADGQALWLEVLAPAPEHSPAPQARAGAGACAERPSDSRPGGGGDGDAEQGAPPSTSGRSGSDAGDRASGLHASTVLVAACCGERLELHPDGPGCFVLRHAGAANSEHPLRSLYDMDMEFIGFNRHAQVPSQAVWVLSCAAACRVGARPRRALAARLP